MERDVWASLGRRPEAIGWKMNENVGKMVGLHIMRDSDESRCGKMQVANQKVGEGASATFGVETTIFGSKLEALEFFEVRKYGEPLPKFSEAR